MHVAARFSNLEIIQIFVESGVDLYIKNKDLRTALDVSK